MYRAFYRYHTSYDSAPSRIKQAKTEEDYLTKSYSSITDLHLRQGISEMGHVQVMTMLMSEASFLNNKKPEYFIHPGIDIALSETNFDIPVSEFNVPFEAFTINFHRSSKVTYRGKSVRSLLVFYPGKNNILVTARPHHDPMLCITIQTEEARWPQSGETLTFLLRGEQTLEDRITKQYAWTNSEDIKVIKIALGVSFMAISKDREYVNRIVIKIKGNDTCRCGSGKKYKKCCKLRGVQNVGYEIGRGLYIPTQAKPGTYTVHEGRGKELKYSHITSGHMKYQRYKVCACGSEKSFKKCCDRPGAWARKLIFISPYIKGRGKPMKPQLTPHVTKRPQPRRKPSDARRLRRNPVTRLCRSQVRGHGPYKGDAPFDPTGRKGSSSRSPRRSTRGGSPFDIGPRRPSDARRSLRRRNPRCRHCERCGGCQ